MKLLKKGGITSKQISPGRSKVGSILTHLTAPSPDPREDPSHQAEPISKSLRSKSRPLAEQGT